MIIVALAGIVIVPMTLGGIDDDGDDNDQS